MRPHRDGLDFAVKECLNRGSSTVFGDLKNVSFWTRFGHYLALLRLRFIRVFQFFSVNLRISPNRGISTVFRLGLIVFFSPVKNQTVFTTAHVTLNLRVRVPHKIPVA